MSPAGRVRVFANQGKSASRFETGLGPSISAMCGFAETALAVDQVINRRNQRHYATAQNR